MIKQKGICFLFLLAVIVLFGCISPRQYRQNLVKADEAQKCKKYTEAKDCETAEEGKEPPYFLGIVEFDDNGLLFDPEQLNFVIDNLIRNATKDSVHAGTIVVAFAHGWNHNAAPGDESLEFFRELLKILAKHEKDTAKLEKDRKPRFVQGVYLGWPGHSMHGLKLLTFFARKTAAHRIGEREATQTLLRLRDAVYGNTAVVLPRKNNPISYVKTSQKTTRPNRFIIVGHSFGGALVYSAISQLLSWQLLYYPQALLELKLADSVILINPAFEATRVLPLFRTPNHNIACESALDTPTPKLTIFTSDSDFATKAAFAWIQFPSNINPFRYRHEVPNPLRYGDPISEQSSDNLSIGNSDHLTTHFLIPLEKANEAKVKCADPKSGIQDELTRTHKMNYDNLRFGQTCLAIANSNGGLIIPGFSVKTDLKCKKLAVFNVKVDKKIWDGHGLDQKEGRLNLFLGFLEHFITFSLGENF